MRALRSIPSGASTSTTPSSSAQANLSVPAFLSSRSHELASLSRAIHSSKEASNKQAFQTLPRHLKRRAASWNVRRVPERLRQRAKRELDHKKMGTKKKKGKKGEDMARWARRQSEKKWLNTHLWHAKRMHMVDVWGFRLAHRPTEKTHRATYRASLHGCTVHDASYHSIIEVEWPRSWLLNLLDGILDPGERRDASGKRVMRVTAYEWNAYPRGLVGPLEMVFQPEQENEEIAKLFIIAHPLQQSHLLEVLTEGATKFCEKLGTKDVERPIAIRVASDDIGVLHLGGERALEVLDACVSCTGMACDMEWEEIRKLGVDAMPNNTVVGLQVWDPRLSFPPKLKHASERSDGELDYAKVFNGTQLAMGRLWERDERKGPKATKKDLDELRSKALIPSAPLHPTDGSDHLPLLLLFSSTSFSKRITILHPRPWTVPLFHSLVYVQPRVLGLHNVRHVALEANEPAWPADWLGDDSSKLDEGGKEKWGKRPRGKCELPNGLGELWDDAFRLWPLSQRPDEAVEGDEEEMDVDHVVGEEEDDVDQGLAPEEKEEEPLWIRGALWQSLPKNPSLDMLSGEIARLRKSRDMPPLDPPLSPSDLSNCIVPVRLEPLSRGTVEPFAFVYSIRNPKTSPYREKGTKTGWKEVIEVDSESALDLIGRVTSGGYLLAEGKGGGIGFVKLQTWKEAAICVVRNRESPVGRMCRMLGIV
ncbi:POP1-domain-containing protein [Atractiella rhizophila]|nr:POP1-domain-containing protein [Atractiella rhizophila]